MTNQENELISQLKNAITSLASGSVPEPIVLPNQLHENLTDLCRQTNHLIELHSSSRTFLAELAKGNLRVDPPPRNNLISQFKQLHANLRHLTWQTKQVASGDYSQHLDFMGDFSDSFNAMILELREKRTLEEELIEAHAYLEKRVESRTQDLLLAKEKLLIEMNRREREVEEKQKLEARLQQAEKTEAIGILAGGIAHDFNNILSAIIGFTDLAMDDAEQGSRQEESLVEVYSAGIRAKELIKQILAFARKSAKSTIPVDIGQITAEALRLLRATTPVTIKLQQSIKSSSYVMADKSQLHQVIMNLCTNAIHGIDDQEGVVEVGLKNVTISSDCTVSGLQIKAGEYVKLTVSDTGKGIDSAIIDKIFDPYYTTKDVDRGTGMGLATVKGIVEGSGGHIFVVSAPGKETVFTVYFPVTPTPEKKIDKKSHNLPTGTERILFVDDEPTVSVMGCFILERLGYSVISKDSSLEALELFKESPESFDLIITDMTMPQMTGDILTNELKKIRPDIPIIICTGYSKKVDPDNAKEFGVDAFIYKPITKEDFAHSVRNVLDKTNKQNMSFKLT